MQAGEYRPPRGVHLAVLRGVFNFGDMRDHEIRPVVWVIAHAKPANSLERSVPCRAGYTSTLPGLTLSSSLKSAVSNLAVSHPSKAGYTTIQAASLIQ